MKSGKETVLSGVGNVNEGVKRDRVRQKEFSFLSFFFFKLFFFHDSFINLMQLFRESC